jgi:hypothetical protein
MAGVGAALALTACSPSSLFTARNTIPGVPVSTASAPIGRDAEGYTQFDPAGNAAAKITAKTAIADCGRQCAGKPSRVLLARLGTELGAVDSGKLAWIIEYDNIDCPFSGPPGSQPVEPMTCTDYFMVDAMNGGPLEQIQAAPPTG